MYEPPCYLEFGVNFIHVNIDYVIIDPLIVS